MLKILFRKSMPGADTIPDALVADLDRLYAATAPVRTFNPAAVSVPAASEQSRRPLGRYGFRLALGIAGVAVTAAAALTVSPMLLRDAGPQPVSAAGLIEKAREASAVSPPYYRSTRSVLSDAGGQPTHQTYRIWAKDAEHWKSEIYETDPATGKPGRFLAGSARDGDEFWTYFQDGEILRVINRDVASMGKMATLYSLPTSVDEMLAAYSNCGGDAMAGPGETIAGRETMKVTINTDPARCPGVISQTLWIDPETYLLMRAESSSGRQTKRSRDGSVVEVNLASLSMIVDELSDGPITDEQVAFAPPPGTRVNYQDRGEIIQVP